MHLVDWLPTCLHWPFCPGVFIAALAFLAAAVTFRRDPTSREKAIWIFVFLLFMCSEVWMMSKDRYQHDTDQARAAKEVADRFQSIADGMDRSAAAVAATLATAQQTFSNTEPRAVLAFEDFSPAFPPLVFAPNVRQMFNVYFANTGNDDAIHILHGGRLYIDKPDDLEVQKRLSRDFDKWWNDSQRPGQGQGGTVAAASGIQFFSFVSPPFGADEVKKIQDRKATFYIFLRLIYSDHTGRWVNDQCSGMQDPLHDTTVFHPCKVHNNPRHDIRQPREIESTRPTASSK